MKGEASMQIEENKVTTHYALLFKNIERKINVER